MKDDAQTLPYLEDGEEGTIVSLALREKQTRPPSRYTEGTLLDDMKGAAKFIENDPKLKAELREVTGIGTAATRDAVIEGLKHDKYLELKKKNLVPTPKGMQFIKWLRGISPELTDVALTARWEAELGVVAKKGGGINFEKNVETMVKNLVATLKVAPRIGGLSTSTTSKETAHMADTDNARATKPTDKMLDYAKKIATRLNIRVPDEVMTDFEVCKQFIDDNKDAANRPSDKQLSFANNIAETKGLTIPPEVQANGRELSKWIDENKG
ncbi:hypothetical protein LC612_23165 [Nostoc sp. CHAB 5834]|nr:hypothetical protein [Nostoc sp. CHAB 5834]